jgi:hypothetical protein
LAHVRVLFGGLKQHQQDALIEWLGGKAVGLWIYGSRRAGSSYIGRIAGRMASQNPEIETSDLVAALDLVNDIRRSWSLGEMVRRHPDDYALWLDMDELERKIESLWALDLLWIDDLHEEAVDISFWRKHVQPYVEKRIKEGKLTIVSTSLSPDSPKLLGLQQVIEDLFVTCYAER